MIQTKERLEMLADKYKAIQTAIFSPLNGECVLKRKQKNLFLQGFALASFRDDIIFQMAWSYGRCALEELESFLDDNLDQIREYDINYKIDAVKPLIRL